MLPTADEIQGIQPRVTERANGLGWVAASPAGAPIQIGVWNQSREGASEDFKEALKRWARILEEQP